MNEFQRAAVVALTTLVAACGRSKPEPNPSLGDLTHPGTSGIPEHLREQAELLREGQVIRNEVPGRHDATRLDPQAAEARRIIEQAAAGVPSDMQLQEGSRGSMLNGTDGAVIKGGIGVERARLNSNIPPKVQAAIDKARADAAKVLTGGK